MLIGDLFEDEWEERPRNDPKLNKAFKAAVYSNHSESEEHALQLLRSNYKNIVIALNQFSKGDQIYRGVSLTNDVVMIDPTKATRAAANTSNFMNMLVSNILPSWSGWPPRDHSLICTTDWSTARGYGGTGGSYEKGPHVVLPFGDPVIGICGATDFWGSFEGLYPPSMNDMFENVVKDYLHRPIGQTPEQLKKDLLDLSAHLAANPADKLEILDNWGSEYKPLLQSANWIQGLSEMLEPNKNRFSRIKLSALAGHFAGANREVWLSAPSLLARRSIVYAFLDEMKNVEI